MKNLIVFYSGENKDILTTKIEDLPIPENSLRPNDVLIKVAVAGSNPKDWKHPLPVYFNVSLNQGDDCSGTIAAIGSAVKSFRVGERVAGFHEMDTLNGTYAEFAIVPEQTVFRIPDSISDEEAATIPLAIYTASVGLYRNLGIPAPWERIDVGGSKVPLVINAAGSAVGSFAIKLAKLNPRISPIIAVAGSSADYVRSIGADSVVDYRGKNVREEIKKAANGVPIEFVFDAANSFDSITYLAGGGKDAVLKSGSGRYTSTMPVGPNKLYDPKGEGEQVLKDAGVWYEQIWVGDVHEQPSPGKEKGREGGKLFGGVMSRVIEQCLADGRLRGQPYEVVERGLEGVEAALYKLRDRKGGNSKFVTRIADTPGL